MRTLLALSIGGIFVLPHLLRMAVLGSYEAYSPFSAESPSPMVWDETFLYGAEANYSMTRHRLASDTDTWEHRDDVFPYSVLPIATEVELARLLGSLKAAQIAVSFLFPALSAALLMLMFARLGASEPLGALLACAVLVVGFSPETLLLDDWSLLLHGSGVRAVDTLQGGRFPSPAFGFALLLLAMFSAAQSLQRAGGRIRAQRWTWAWAAGAGLLGGLLFFSYAYYGIAWAAALAFLALLSFVPRARVEPPVRLALVASLLSAVPFLLWKYAATMRGSYLPRTSRLGLATGHKVTAVGLLLSFAWGLLAVLCAAGWRRLRGAAKERGGTRQESALLPPVDRWRFADAMLPVAFAAMVGGIAGLNMQVVTGFNVQAEHHFPHMVLQPVGVLLVCSLIALAFRGTKSQRNAAVAGFAFIMAACLGAQVESARNSAALHRVRPGDAALFAWLNANSAADAVVATDDLRLSVLLPTMTHDDVLFANGSRSTASDDELLERFLLASRLTGASHALVQQQLEQPVGDTKLSLPISTYSYYLFESSRYEAPGEHFISGGLLPAILGGFDGMDAARELRKFRADYVWVPNGREPMRVEGWELRPVFANADGRLWAMRSAGGQNASSGK